MRIYCKILIFMCLITLVGCVPPTLFNWGSYSSTLYSYKKDPTKKNLEEHKKSISHIIVDCERRRLKVPPGVNAELGYYLAKEGKINESKDYFFKEEKLYPESKVFVDKLLIELEKGAVK